MRLRRGELTGEWVEEAKARCQISEREDERRGRKVLDCKERGGKARRRHRRAEGRRGGCVGVEASDLPVPSPPLPTSRRGPTSRVAQMVAGSFGEGRVWVGQGPKTSATQTVLGVQHTWHPGLTICSELNATRARGVGLERDKDTAWGVNGFASTAAMNSVNQRL